MTYIRDLTVLHSILLSLSPLLSSLPKASGHHHPQYWFRACCTTPVFIRNGYPGLLVNTLMKYNSAWRKKNYIIFWVQSALCICFILIHCKFRLRNFKLNALVRQASRLKKSLVRMYHSLVWNIQSQCNLYDNQKYAVVRRTSPAGIPLVRLLFSLVPDDRTSEISNPELWLLGTPIWVDGREGITSGV